jgi:hypothetical protein
MSGMSPLWPARYPESGDTVHSAEYAPGFHKSNQTAALPSAPEPSTPGAGATFTLALPIPGGQLVLTLRVVPSAEVQPVGPPASANVEPAPSADRDAVVWQRAREEGDK